MKAPDTHSLPPAAPAQDFRQLLQEELLKRCRRNPRYSVRAFAKALGCDFSTLSKILRGQRPVGKLTIRKLGARLGLTPTEVEAYERRAARSKLSAAAGDVTPAFAGAQAETNYQQLTLDAFTIIADWYHYALLELMRLPNFRSDARWIARALGIPLAEARSAIERLVRVGILEIRPDGSWKDLSEGFSTTIGNEFTASAFRRLQRGILEKALNAIEEVPIERRDQSSMTMAIESRRMPEAKRMIKAFRRELNQFLSPADGTPDEVYHLSVSLYPVTHQTSPKPQTRRSRKEENV